MELEGGEFEYVITTLAQLENLKSILHSPKCNLQRLKVWLKNEEKYSYLSLRSFCEDLADAILSGRCGGLLELDLVSSCIPFSFVEILATALASVQSLNLLNNSVGDEGAKILAEALASGKCALRSLNLSNNYITDRGTRFLADALLSGRCGLLDLSLNGNDLFKTGETVKVLAAALASSHCKIQTLNLSNVTKGNVFGDEIANNLAEALLSGNCALVNLHLARNSIGDKGTQSLANAISNTLCKLQRLDLSGNNITETGQEALVNALRANVRCQIEKLELEWTSYALKLQFDKLVNRNGVFRGEGVDVQPADIAKLFLCGFSGVGKTTIRKNINKKLALRKYPEPHAPTTGMDLQTLKFGKKKLLICDLAGQKEFHAFHHYFVRGSDKDLFLVVCKDTSPGYETQFQDDLRYWLRFIVCHRSSPSAPKPKVCIAVNYFSPLDIDCMKHNKKRVI